MSTLETTSRVEGQGETSQDRAAVFRRGRRQRGRDELDLRVREDTQNLTRPEDRWSGQPLVRQV